MALSQALEALQRSGASQEEVKKSLGVVEEAARADGLQPDHLISLAEFVAARNTNATLLSRGVRSLIPKISVPCAAVLRLLGSLKGHTLSLQLLIIRWIILVYDIIDNRTNLHAIYGTLFYYLQSDELRPVVCQLLCYMTRRCDVTHYRVQRLTELSKRVDSHRGAEPGLLALLVLYHTLCPHMLGNPQRGRKKVWFRPFEKQLSANIRRVQKARQSDETPQPNAEKQLHKQLTGAPPPLKKARRRYDVVALSVAPSRSHGGGRRREGQMVAFDAVTTHHILCENIPNIEFPGQVARVLKLRSLQHMFSVCCEPSAAMRFTYWLEHSLGYELDCYTPGCVNSDLQSLLSDLYTLTKFIQEPIPTVESFLHILLEEWNGDDYRNEIMDLLSHISLQPFDDFEKAFLKPLKQLFLSKDREFKCQCLRRFSQMLRNMAVFELPRRQSQLASDSNRFSLFLPVSDEDVDDFNAIDTISLFTKYVDHIIVIALEQEKQHLLLYHAAMEFYGVVADLPLVYGIQHLSLPSPSVLVCGLIGHSPFFISSACAHLVKVKENLSALSKNERSLKLTQTFNSVVLDFCNSLWRNMIFRKSSSNKDYPTLAFDIPREELERCGVTQPQKRLNLVHHPAMVGFVLRFLAETQEADKLDQLAPSAIWQETRFKQVYLQFLTQNHLSGISEFIQTFVHTN